MISLTLRVMFYRIKTNNFLGTGTETIHGGDDSKVQVVKKELTVEEQQRAKQVLLASR
jgi:hypothetical protein